MIFDKWQQMGCDDIVFTNVEDFKPGFPRHTEYFLRCGTFKFELAERILPRYFPKAYFAYILYRLGVCENLYGGLFKVGRIDK